MQKYNWKAFSKVAENRRFARASLPSLERASKIKGFARANNPSLERSDETVKVLDLDFYARYHARCPLERSPGQRCSLERGILRSSEEAKSGISRFVSQVRTKHSTTQNSTSWAQILENTLHT